MNKTELFADSHAHITSPQVFEKVDEVLTRAQDARVRAIINICTDSDTLEKGLELKKRYPWVYNVASTTPHDVDREGESFLPQVQRAAENGELVGIGETGLDYFYAHSDRENQQRYLRKYLQMARALDLPVVIHCRDAFEDFFRILDEEYVVDGKHLPGVLHCFTGTLDEAKEVVKRGWYLSLSGIVTFKRSEELRQVAEYVPMDQLLIETDSPYLAPQSKRGKQNEPSYLPETAELIARLKGVEVDGVARVTAANVADLFRLSK